MPFAHKIDRLAYTTLLILSQNHKTLSKHLTDSKTQVEYIWNIQLQTKAEHTMGMLSTVQHGDQVQAAIITDSITNRRGYQSSPVSGSYINAWEGKCKPL